MGNYVQVGNTGEFKDVSKKKVTAAGQEIMLARVGGSYYAIGSRCPHLGGDLSKGTLEGTTVTCPRHGSQFDIRDGKNLRWMKGTGLAAAVGKTLKPPRGVPSYNVKVEGDAILVEV